MNLLLKYLSQDLWDDVVTLFGSNGACGGCWCQAWRYEKGEKWKDIQGDEAKNRLHNGIANNKTFAVIAYDGAKPVGWCTYGPRLSFPRIERARTLKCNDAELAWSIPCFFVLRGYRKNGIAAAMLDFAIKDIKNRGGKIAEAYPSKPDKDGKYIDTFAWTGTQSLFIKAGFIIAGNEMGSKQRVRKYL